MEMENYIKTEELNNMLAKAHKMLADIDIPVAPLDKIAIAIDPNKRKRHIATCEQEYGDDEFLILFHYYSLKEKETDGEKQVTFSTILHELIHTCYNPSKKEYGLWEHDTLFVQYARKTKKIYGYNLLRGFRPRDFQYAHKSPLAIFACKSCDFETWVYDKAQLEKWETAITEDRIGRCPYCGQYHVEKKLA